MKHEISKALGLITQVGISMLVPIFICFLVGVFLDKWLHTGSIFMIIFIVLGVMAGFRSIYMMTKEYFVDKDTYIPTKNYSKNDENNDDDESGDF